MSAPARHRSRRRIAAFNFLSNISLDGSHRDTKYSIFLKRGLDHVNYSEKGSKRSQTEPENLKRTDGQEKYEWSGVCVVKSRDDVLNLNGEKTPGFSTGTPIKTPSVGSSKRASCFTDAKVQATRRRRSLFHTYSISEDTSEIELQSSSSSNVPLSKSSFHGGRLRHKSSSSSHSQDSLGSYTKSSHNQSKVSKTVKFACNGEKFQKNDRVVLLTGCKVPFAVFSTLPYFKQTKHGEVSKKKLDRFSIFPGSFDLLGSGLGSDDAQAVSYSQFLVPSKKSHPQIVKKGSQDNQLYPIAESNSAQSSPGVVVHPRPFPPLRSFSYDPSVVRQAIINCPISSSDEAEGDNGGDLVYDPGLLDDPELRSGKHRTLMTFTSYMTSVIDYAKPSELKKELNEKFKEMFPHIQLTLTKLRSLKIDLKKIAVTKCGIDLWTVAQAYVFFEKIILKGLILKTNRRLVAGASLMLSAKLNDVKGTELTKLINELEDYFKLNRKDLLKCEFGVLIALEFSLHVPDKDVSAHHQRLLFNS